MEVWKDKETTFMVRFGEKFKIQDWSETHTAISGLEFRRPRIFLGYIVDCESQSGLCITDQKAITQKVIRFFSQFPSIRSSFLHNFPYTGPLERLSDFLISKTCHIRFNFSFSTEQSKVGCSLPAAVYRACSILTLGGLDQARLSSRATQRALQILV
jgi:hypothetical protein